METIFIKLLFIYFYSVYAAPQNPEINDDYETTTEIEKTVFVETGNSNAEVNKTSPISNASVTIGGVKKPSEPSILKKNEVSKTKVKEVTSMDEITYPSTSLTKYKVLKQSDILKTTEIEPGVVKNIFEAISTSIKTFITAPKVYTVLRNIGVCIVNGAMEVISFYLPAPLMPLVVSVAGLVIPFEPVAMLRKRMPVTSYNTALLTAVNTFLGTFDKYKVDDNLEDDPYMTMRFNRRFMNHNSDEKSNKHSDK